MGFLVHFYITAIKRNKNHPGFIDNKHFLMRFGMIIKAEG